MISIFAAAAPKPRPGTRLRNLYEAEAGSREFLFQFFGLSSCPVRKTEVQVHRRHSVEFSWVPVVLKFPGAQTGLLETVATRHLHSALYPVLLM